MWKEDKGGGVMDEAITQEREKAEIHRFNSCHVDAELYADDPEEIENAKERCIKCAEEHEQLAVWLEELKAYRKIGTVEECKESVLDIEKAYNKGYADGSLSVTSEIRNKVIDDFVCYMCNEFDSKYAAIEEHTREYVIKLVHSIGEELKAGRKNE